MGTNCATTCKEKTQNAIDKGREEMYKRKQKRASKSINDLVSFIPTEGSRSQSGTYDERTQSMEMS